MESALARVNQVLCASHDEDEEQEQEQNKTMSRRRRRRRISMLACLNLHVVLHAMNAYTTIDLDTGLDRTGQESWSCLLVPGLIQLHRGVCYD